MALVAFCFSCAFLFLELIIPGVVYLNLAVASLIMGGAMLLTANPYIIAGVFLLSLAGSFTIVRPKIMTLERKLKCQENVRAQYIGKIAQVVERTDKNSGILSINNERWQARTTNDEAIEQGQEAKITNFKDIVMYVEKV